MAKIEFVALGGLDEYGKACYLLIIDENIFIINCGILIPSTVSSGIQAFIPDFSYLWENKQRIKGVFIGTPYDHNIGALNYLIKELNVPIYTNELNAQVIKSYFPKTNFNFSLVHELKPITIANVNITPFKITNTFGGSFGFIFGTDQHNVIYIDDAILCTSRMSFLANDLLTMGKLVDNKKTNILITATGKIEERSEFSITSGSSVGAYISNLVYSAPGRFIVALYSWEEYKLLQLLKASNEHHRPIVFYNQATADIINAFDQQKLITRNKYDVVDAKNLGKYDDAIIVIMNAKHEMFEQLHQIITNNDPNLQFRPNDTFFFASQTINGLERKEANLFNDLSLIDIHQAIKIDKKYHDLRPAAEDHKYITSLVNPQFIIPCSGLYMDFIKYKNIVSRIVVNSTDKQQKVLIIPNGLFLEFNDRVVKSNVKPVLDLRPSPINLQGEIEFFDSLIRESTQMQANGIMLVNFLIDKKLKKITKTAYDLLGVIDLDGPAKEALKQIETDAENNANKLLDDYDRPEFDIKEFKNTIRKKVSKLMHGRFEKDPIVVVSTLFL